ncbi:MAG: protein-ER retention protein [Lichina confinis]|nr:MAG: protein-ER retention protein [Lichina confinis]
MIRLRQCLIEYYRVKNSGDKSGGWGGQHLANALKYSTALPVILLGALQKGYNPSGYGVGQVALNRLWLLSVFLNSFYSFYWDVTKDWDLSLLSSSIEREHPEYPFGLRRQRFFHSPGIYYAAILIDFVLRFAWSLKLSPYLDRFNDMEAGIFFMEMLEVLRRWIWIFFRVETEWVRNNQGLGVDDILLENYDKMDDD